jgi:hypothetical protein
MPTLCPLPCQARLGAPLGSWRFVVAALAVTSLLFTLAFLVVVLTNDQTGERASQAATTAERYGDKAQSSDTTPQAHVDDVAALAQDPRELPRRLRPAHR